MNGISSSFFFTVNDRYFDCLLLPMFVFFQNAKVGIVSVMWLRLMKRPCNLHEKLYLKL